MEKIEFTLSKFSPLIKRLPVDLESREEALLENIFLTAEDEKKAHAEIADYLEVNDLAVFIKKLNQAYQEDGDLALSDKVEFAIKSIENDKLGRKVYCFGLWRK